MPIVTTNFPNYGPRMKVLHTGPAKKRLENNPKRVSAKGLKREKREHGLNFKLKSVHEMLIPM